MDFVPGRFTRRCAISQQELAPGDAYYSALFEEGEDVVRRDYGEAAWEGPPEGAFSWWKSEIPDAVAKPTLAPSDVILQYFEQLEEQFDKADVRYVLALLMVRKRITQLEYSETDDAGIEWLVLYCPRNENEYRAQVATPNPQRAAEIQEELMKLLYDDVAS